MGFYVPCEHQCSAPAAFDMSKSRWRCNKHAKYILNSEEGMMPIPFNYYDQLLKRLEQTKQYRSNRLGLNYTVTIRRYNNKNVNKYFENIKIFNLTIRTQQPIARWNRVSRFHLKAISDEELIPNPSPHNSLNTNKRLTSDKVIIKRFNTSHVKFFSHVILPLFTGTEEKKRKKDYRQRQLKAAREKAERARKHPASLKTEEIRVSRQAKYRVKWAERDRERAAQMIITSTTDEILLRHY